VAGADGTEDASDFIAWERFILEEVAKDLRQSWNRRVGHRRSYRLLIVARSRSQDLANGPPLIRIGIVNECLNQSGRCPAKAPVAMFAKVECRRQSDFRVRIVDQLFENRHEIDILKRCFPAIEAFEE
jgi:hypothetical protein